MASSDGQGTPPRAGAWMARAASGVGRALTSPRLAIALLVVVLACCVAGVTVVRGVRAGQLIFSTLWFNGLLVLLALSSAAAFFTRIWRRRLTLVSGGMILFHLSFMALLGGIVYQSLFRFEGVMRITEGETLPNGQRESYDEATWGRLFDPARLTGETTLLRMHANYEVDGENKRAAYEIAVSDGDRSVEGIVYATRQLEFDGVRYYSLKEGYSVLVVMYDAKGNEIYGVHLPLQSYAQPDRSYTYATGFSTGPGTVPYPAPPDEPRFELRVDYRPSSVTERAGDVTFDVRPLGPHGPPAIARKGQVPVGGTFDAGDVKLVPREIRYWVGMTVRYDPGLTFILASLTAGLAGMVLTFVGRLRQGGPRGRDPGRVAPA